MKDVIDLRAIAQEMKAAQDEVRQIAPFTSRLAGFDNEAAYNVARLIHDQRVEEGFVPIGRKIGFTNPEMWDLYGVREPIWVTTALPIHPAEIWETQVKGIALPGMTVAFER